MNQPKDGETVNTMEPLHIWYRCYNCKAAPIVGTRYHCTNAPEGPDNDLCSNCYALFQAGSIQSPLDLGFAATVSKEPARFEASEGHFDPAYLDWLAVPHPAVEAPAVPDGFVIRPEFCSGYESTFGGYAFVVNVPQTGKAAVLTALHVMDEMIKKKNVDSSVHNPAYTGRELPAVISKVNLYNLFAPNWMIADMGTAGPMLVMPDARTHEEEPYSHRDIVGFWASGNSQLCSGNLAATTPGVGEPIWLVSHFPETGERVQKVVVVEVTEKSFIYKFESDQAGPLYTSGSPLLNAAGDVVALNVGGGHFQGRRLGHANHVANIRRHLADAVRAEGGH